MITVNFKKLAVSVPLLLTTVAASVTAHANENIYSLAQGCYAIKSPDTGRYMQRGGGDYRFDSIAVEDAAHFYFKPTSLGKFMLRDRSGQFLSTRLPLDVARGSSPEAWAEWGMESTSNGYYRFITTKFWKRLRLNKGDGGTYLIDLLNPKNNNSESRFELVAQSDCASFPEAELNASINESIPATSDIDDPVVGFADVHTHLNSNEFMGGKFLHGKPFHRFGVEKALKDGHKIHGPNGGLDLIGNMQDSGNIQAKHDTRGYPDFPYWPNHHTMSHQQGYYKWIERVHLSGLKLMVTHMVENEVLCKAQRTINPASWINANDCNNMVSIDHQLDRVFKMQDYIDAQAGGPGKGFFRIVRSAEEARTVIADGKLAVVLGVEVSSVLDCSEGSGCSEARVDEKLGYLYSRGIRSLFPIHKFDNDFGGAHMNGADEFINLGNMLQTGHLYRVEGCPELEPSHRKLANSFPVIGGIPILSDFFNVAGLSPDYDQSLDLHCNSKHLTAMGAYLINRMIDMEMIIEVDHMSAGAMAETMEIVEARGYSGLLSSHSGPKLSGMPSPLQQRMLDMGGLMFPYNGPSQNNIRNIDSIRYAVEQTQYLPGVGLGSDINGLANQAGRSATADSNPIGYPFTSHDGRVTFDRQTTGNRSFDLNNEGLAHYGLMADLVEDMRINAEPETMTALFNSAEAYLQMWERATPESNKLYVQLKDKRSGRCLNVPGDHRHVKDGAAIGLYSCDNGLDQLWYVDIARGKIVNRADPEICLGRSASPAADGTDVLLKRCADDALTDWLFDGDLLRDPSNPDAAMDAFGDQNNANVGMWTYHGGNNQRWNINVIGNATESYNALLAEFAKRSSKAYVQIRNKQSGRCLNIAGGGSSVVNNVEVGLYNCDDGADQKWFVDTDTGFVHNSADPSLCLAHPDGNALDGLDVRVWECSHGGGIVRWDMTDQGAFRSYNNNDFVLATECGGNNCNVQLWRDDGSTAQQWELVY